MGRFLTLMTLMILGALAVRTQDPSPFTTNGQVNGLLWRNMPPDPKLAYVTGAKDGFYQGVVGWAKQYPTAGHPWPAWLGSRTITNGDIVKEINSFYEDGANIFLPMIDAFQYSEMKLGGATKQELDSFLKSVK